MNRLVTGLVAIALGVSLLTAPAALPAAEPVAAYTAAASVATKYADPDWYPLRRPAELRCVFKTCVREPEYEALDLASAAGVRGEPVYAAGKGVLRIGATNLDCTEDKNAQSTRGNWAWVDHGGGVVSKYQHLDTVRIDLKGKIVGPTTVIGTMGRSGSWCGGPFYLHFETRSGGVNGTPDRYAPPLRTCEGAKIAVYPRDLGFPTWNDVPRDTLVPGGTDGCYSDPITADRPSAIYQRRGNTWARVRWPAAPAGTQKIAVERQELVWDAASDKWKWGRATYLYLPGSDETTVWQGLDTSGQPHIKSLRKYRARVAFRNKNGYSVWTGWRRLVGPPRVPAFREILAGRTRVTYRWKKPLHNGLEVSSYTVAIRPKINGTWRKWSSKSIPDPGVSAYWTGLRSGRTYAVRVRAHSGKFASRFNSVRTITTTK